MESLGWHLNVNRMTVKWAIFEGGFTLRVGRIKESQGGSWSKRIFSLFWEWEVKENKIKGLPPHWAWFKVFSSHLSVLSPAVWLECQFAFPEIKLGRAWHGHMIKTRCFYYRGSRGCLLSRECAAAFRRFQVAAAPRHHPRRSLLSPGNAVPMTNYQMDAKRWDRVKCAVLCKQNI